MRCKDAESSILSSEKLTKELNQHVSECRSCKILFDEWSTLKELKGKIQSPPKSIDFLITREAHRFSVNRTTMYSAFTRWASLTATAACIMIISWVCLNSIDTTIVPSPNTAEDVNKIITSISIPENLNIANSMPVLIDLSELEPDAETNFETQIIDSEIDLDINESMLHFTPEDQTLDGIFGDSFDIALIDQLI
jgi:hypothetical protein